MPNNAVGIIEVGAIPTELRERRQWLVWHYDKGTKVPRRASSTNPASWMPYSFAAAIARKYSANGIGFVFSEADPYVGIDLDHCVSDGTIHPAAQAIINRLDSWWEFSPSGRGVHVIVRGHLPDGVGHKTAITQWRGALEIYDRARYFTMSGAGRGEIANRQAALDQLVRDYLPVRTPDRELDWTEPHDA